VDKPRFEVAKALLIYIPWIARDSEDNSSLKNEVYGRSSCRDSGQAATKDIFVSVLRSWHVVINFEICDLQVFLLDLLKLFLTYIV